LKHALNYCKLSEATEAFEKDIVEGNTQDAQKQIRLLPHAIIDTQKQTAQSDKESISENSMELQRRTMDSF